MAESVTIRIDSQVKLNLESFKEKQPYSCKTHSDAIENLLSYHDANERNRRAELQKREEEKQQREASDISLGSELKQTYKDFCLELGVSERAGLQFLLQHFEESGAVGKESFNLLLYLKSGREV